MTITQQKFTFSKSKRKLLEKVCNMLKVNNKDTRTTLINVVLVPLLLTLNIFRTFFDVSIADLEHVFFCWDFT